MQFHRAMRLAAVQKDRDRSDRDVRYDKRVDDDLPSAETAKAMRRPVE
jgi:hypothetical protein